MVRMASAYVELEGPCAGLLGLDEPSLKALAKQTVMDGHAAFGGEAFGQVLVNEVAETKAYRETHG